MTRGRSTAIIAQLVIFAVACAGGNEGKPVTAGSASGSSVDTASHAIAPAARVNNDSAFAAADTIRDNAVNMTHWIVSAGGIGPVRIGMTAAQARAALGGDLTVTGRDPSCDYASSLRVPEGVNFMVTNGRIARVQVLRGAAATSEGIRIGDSEQHVRNTYAGRITVTPHKYTSGHYLTVTPTDAAQSNDRIIFETDGSHVTVYRSGMLPEVAWVEGCS